MDEKCYVINQSPGIKYRVICFCHAGGYATQYNVWRKMIPSSVQCVIYERPGVGLRLSEELVDDWGKLIEDASEQLAKFLDLPFIVFGHSLGGSLGFEFCKIIEIKYGKSPLALLIGDREGPNVAPEIMRSDLSTYDFLSSLKQDYGISDDIINKKEIVEMFLPALRNDFRLADGYQIYHCSDKNGKISAPVIVLRPANTQDSLESHQDWQNYTNGEFKIVNMPGDHFFQFSYPLETIRQLLMFFKL